MPRDKTGEMMIPPTDLTLITKNLYFAVQKVWIEMTEKNRSSKINNEAEACSR